MVRPESPAILGDTGKSAPENWQFGGPGNNSIHIVLLLYAETAKRESLTMRFTQMDCPGLTEIFRQNSARHDAFEPFGFRDGISQPFGSRINTTTLDTTNLVESGEFILGYENEYGRDSSFAANACGIRSLRIKLLPVDRADSTTGNLAATEAI